MISRRRILSRSRDELLNGQYPNNYNPYEEEEDVWYSKDKLLKDHILEILNKWEQIDDEIWAKLICMERNRRVAKAYARAPTLTINGSDGGFDGYRIGLNGFDNPLRDPKTDMVKLQIGDGVKIHMDNDGNILIRRLAKSNVYVKGWQPMSSGTGQATGINDGNMETSVSSEIIRNNGLLELNKVVRLFDIKRFQNNMNRELRRAYPDRRKLENQCICCIAFVKDAPDLLDLPVWIMVINIVAMDMLKSKLPPALSKRQSVPNLVSLFDRQKPITEEDPYSIPGNNSSSSGSRSSGHYVSTGPINNNNNNSKSSEPKPPKLPPRDFERNKQRENSNGKNIGKSSRGGFLSSKKSNNKNTKEILEEENNYSMLPGNVGRTYDDPYYSGFSARVPNFAKRSPLPPSPGYGGHGGGGDRHGGGHSHHHHQQQMMLPFKSAYNQPEFHARKVPSTGFLNSYLKSPNVIHSRTASYQSYYGSLGESDPYTVSSEGGPGDDSFTGGTSGIGGESSTYGIARIGMASRYHSDGTGNSSKKQIPYVYRSARNDDYYCGWDE